MNLEAAGGQYTKGAKCECPNEAWVTFHRGRLVTGRLDKKLLGGGAKDGLFAQLNVVAGTEFTARVMGRIARTTSRWLMLRGFSLGLGDVAITESVHQRKQQVVKEAFAECTRLIKDSERGRLQAAPGMSVAQTLEAQLNGVLSRVRDTCGQEAVRVLHRSNAPLVMAQSGSKGSALNIAQMMAVVGQQTVSGARIKHAFFNRTLPHVPRFAEDPAARGFVASSFFSGLKPTEFFFHTMAGREGLVDTAVKTADTGYIQRRVMKACEDLSVQYDWTVRSAKKNIVQFRFGEDSLDPLVMEGSNNAPVNFAAMWKNLVNADEATLAAADVGASVLLTVSEDAAAASSKSKPGAAVPPTSSTKTKAPPSLPTTTAAATSSSSAEQHLGASQAELQAVVTKAVEANKTKYHFTDKFSADVIAFCFGLIQNHCDARSRLRVDDAKASVDERVRRYRTCINLAPCSVALLAEFMSRCGTKYWSKRCEPGTPCGALAAQSLCEPATQMTLRTFHFAGVASMSVTMGVPRLKEIINASKSIKTPIVRAPLKAFITDRLSANIAKAVVERVTLRDVLAQVSQVISSKRVYLRFTLNRHAIARRQINVTSATIRAKIIEYARRPMSPLKELQERHVVIEDNDHFLVHPYREEAGDVYFIMQSLRSMLMDVHIHGIDSARRVIVTKMEEDSSSSSSGAKPGFQLLAETADFLRVMTLPEVDGTRCTCNHVDAVAATLGIEAARTLIVNEIKAVLGAYSMSVDVRHIQLISDVMTHRGVVLGIQNYGIQKMNSGVLTMASFERTTDHLYNACVFQRSDRTLSVSESIIVGAPIPLGTNSFGLLLNYGTDAAQRQHTTAAASQRQFATNATTGIGSSSSNKVDEDAAAADGRSPTIKPAAWDLAAAAAVSAPAAATTTSIVGPVTNFFAASSSSNGGSTVGADGAAAGRRGAKVSFQSIFERSPLTAVPASSAAAAGSGRRAGVAHAPTRPRLYSMERARSGSFALDLSSAV